MIFNKFSSDEFLEKLLDELKLKGFDVSEDSNIVRILNNIISTLTSDRQDIDEIISSLSFDGRNGELLDELYGMFGIPRIIKNTNSVSLTILNNSPNTIILKPNTIIENNGFSYRTVVEQYIYPNETKVIFANPTSIKIIDNFIIINDIKIQLNNIDVEHIPVSEKGMYLQNNILISNFTLNLDKENDLEYSSRAKGLIQHFGDSNLQKIKSYIKGIENVSDIKIYREFNKNRIVIIPTELKYLNEILDQAKESAEYFSSSYVEFDRPTITELNISGLVNQLNDWFKNGNIKISEIINGVKQYLNEYVKDLFLNNETTVSRDSIEFTINKYFVDNNILFSLNENKLVVNYNVYSDLDYIEPIISSSIEPRKSKEIKTDLVIIGSVE